MNRLITTGAQFWCWLENQRPLKRVSLKLALLAVVVLFTLYPNPVLLLRQLGHYLDTESLIQPHLPAMPEINREIDQLIATNAPALTELKAVERFVYRRIAYQYDWHGWWNLDYWPTAAEVWERKREDCDGRAGNTVHCYLVWDEVTREAALFDTGFEAEPVLKVVEAETLDLRHLFITHSHHDHIDGLPAIRERYPTIRIHTDTKGAPPQHRNRRNDCVHLGSLRVSNRETPGHAEDGVTYLIGNWPDDAAHMAVVGDALFAGSMGGAKEHGELAKAKVRDQILSLPPASLICPGHGPLTTVAQERASNPFF